ncbi:MAG: tetratricopeptide repeat protein [Treponemataceae bacterium]|nr:tetratricopeptide repeat protein [Treponemataceae bacterium]
MVQVLLIVAVCVVIAALAVLIIKNVASPKRMDGVQKLIKQGKYQAAVKLAKQIIAKEPQNYRAHYYLGKAYLADNRNELAFMEFKAVEENALFDASLPETAFRKEFAALLLKYNRTEEAMREYLILTKLEPQNPEGYFNAGKLSEQRGRKDLALGFYKKCISLDRKHAKAHAAIGCLLFQAKQFNEAKRELDLAISLNPETYSCYYYLGKLLKETKDYGGAVKAFDKAQRDAEFKQKALIERSACYMMANRLDNAQIDLQRAIELDKDGTKGDTLYARYFLAACYEKSRKIEKAIEQWEIIARQNKSFKDVAAKLSEYQDLQSNDNLKDYLTCADAEFMEICKDAALYGLGLAAQQADMQKFGCQMIAVEAKDGDWRNVRKQMALLRFYRDPDPIEDAAVREALDKAKSSNCAKTFMLSSAGFTRPAAAFAENRPIELVGKEKLEALLSAGAKKRNGQGR